MKFKIPVESEGDFGILELENKRMMIEIGFSGMKYWLSKLWKEEYGTVNFQGTEVFNPIIITSTTNQRGSRPFRILKLLGMSDSAIDNLVAEYIDHEDDLDYLRFGFELRDNISEESWKVLINRLQGNDGNIDFWIIESYDVQSLGGSLSYEIESIQGTALEKDKLKKSLKWLEQAGVLVKTLVTTEPEVTIDSTTTMIKRWYTVTIDYNTLKNLFNNFSFTNHAGQRDIYGIIIEDLFGTTKILKEERYVIWEWFYEIRYDELTSEGDGIIVSHEFDVQGVRYREERLSYDGLRRSTASEGGGVLARILKVEYKQASPSDFLSYFKALFTAISDIFGDLFDFLMQIPIIDQVVKITNEFIAKVFAVDEETILNIERDIFKLVLTEAIAVLLGRPEGPILAIIEGTATALQVGMLSLSLYQIVARNTTEEVEEEKDFNEIEDRGQTDSSFKILKDKSKKKKMYWNYKEELKIKNKRRRNNYELL